MSLKNNMTEIGNNPEFDALISSVQKLETELADLVFERDKLLFHTCPALQAEYMMKIGKLEYAVYEYQCKILRGKRKIELIQAKLNSEQPYNYDSLFLQCYSAYPIPTTLRDSGASV